MIFVLTLVALLALPGMILGQQAAVAPDRCSTGRIATVTVDNGSLFDADDPSLDKRLRWAFRTANALHIRTRHSFLRRELLFRQGDCYDPFLLAESGRLLRGYGFLNLAEVTATLREDGDYDVLVETQDDWSTRVDLRLRLDEGVRLEGISLNEENLLGRGQRLGAFFVEREVTREYGLAYWTPRLFNTRWDLTLALGKTRPGSFVREEIAYPFLGEVGHWGMRQSFQHNDRYFNYIATDDPDLRSPHVLLPMREKFFDLAVVRRLGDRGNMALLGAGISYHELTYPGGVEIAPEGEFDNRVPAESAQAALVKRQAEEINKPRFSVLLGHRNVWWVERRGLDALRGLQDVKLGAEAGLALNRSIPWLESDNDLSVTFTVYTGLDIGGALIVARGRADVIRDLEAPASAAEWEDLYGDAEVLGYWQFGSLPRHTVFFRGAGVGAWNTRTPFQLTLGGERALRGYHSDRFPGGRRATFTLEHRYYVGWPFREVFDLGTTVFGDVGKIWGGDVPFGSDSEWRSSVGFGLRGAFPAGSRTTYRIDLAWPTQKGTGLGDFRVRFSIGDVLGLLSDEGDFQFLRSRPQAVAGQLFQFRN